MTLTEMIARCRYLVGEPNSSNTFLATQAVLEAEINDALTRIMGELRANVTYYDITLIVGQIPYTVNTDFLMIKAVRVLDTNKYYELEYKTMRGFQEYTDGDTTESGRPQIYKLEMGATDTTTAYPADIWVFPKPDSALTMRVYYYQLPSTLSTGTEISELHVFAHKAACYYASANLAMQMSDLPVHDRLIGKFKEEMDMLKDWAFMRQADRAVEMRDEMGYTD